MIAVEEKHLEALTKTIAGRMKKRREELKLTQDYIAEATGLYISHYGSIERGQRLYRIDTFIRILTALDLDLLGVFEVKSRGKSQPKAAMDPERSRILEQVSEILESGGEDAELATMQISRWHKGLPPKKRQ